MPGVQARGYVPTVASATGLTQLNAGLVSGAYSVTWWQRATDIMRINGVYAFVHYGSAVNRQGIRVGARYMTLNTDSTYYGLAPSASFFRVGWHHWAMRYNGSDCLWLLDGRLTERVAAANPPTTGDPMTTEVHAGTAYNAAYQAIGAVFDVRVFAGTALSQGELAATMDPRKNVAGCVARWFRDWNPVVSGIVYDETGNGNNLTMSGDSRNECSQCEEPPWREMVGAR